MKVDDELTIQYEEAIKSLLDKLERANKYLTMYFFDTDISEYGSIAWGRRETQISIINQVISDVRVLSRGTESYDRWFKKYGSIEDEDMPLKGEYEL